MFDFHSIRLFLGTVHYDHWHLIWWAIPGAAMTAFLWLVWWRARLKAIRQYGDLSLVTRFTRLPSRSYGCLTLLGLVSVVVLGFAAATMPYQPLGAVSVPAGTLHVVAAFDVSKSLAAEDYRSNQTLFGGTSCALVEGACGTRENVAKLLLLNQIMPAIKGNEMGMLVYSGDAVTRSPLTEDFYPLREMLTSWHWVDVDSGLGEGSFVDQGLSAAVGILNQGESRGNQPKQQNVILLFTDGGNDSAPADLANAVGLVKKAGAELIIVGVGTPEESPIPRYGDDGKPLYDDHGERSYFLTDSGAMATTARDDTFLEQLKEETGGQLVKVTPGQPVSINWPNALAGSSVQIAKRDLYQYPLALGMAVLGSIWLSAFWSRILALLQQGRRRISRRS